VGVASVHAMADDTEMIVSGAQVLEDVVDAKESSGVEYLRSGSGRTKRLAVLLSVARKANRRVVRTARANSRPANVL
jgi:D-arabinose 5-phosphate isomerase GutQ